MTELKVCQYAYKNNNKKFEGVGYMKNILLHGLGQNETSWNISKVEFEKSSVETENPSLYSMIKTEGATYDVLLKKFIEYCNEFGEKINLCGLSLGGILALDYAKKFPEKVNSLILIGTPYTIPKFLFKLQGMVFHLMPRQSFEKMGIAKKDFISLVNSMSNLEIAHKLDSISCKTLILCGDKDNQNKSSAELLRAHIKNSSFQIVANSSHEVNIDNPKDLVAIVSDFWNPHA